jgi:hypothetical protein
MVAQIHFGGRAALGRSQKLGDVEEASLSLRDRGYFDPEMELNDGEQEVRNADLLLVQDCQIHGDAPRRRFISNFSAPEQLRPAETVAGILDVRPASH